MRLSTLNTIVEVLTSKRNQYAQQKNVVNERAVKYRKESNNPNKKDYMVFDAESERFAAIDERLSAEIRTIDRALSDLYQHDFS